MDERQSTTSASSVRSTPLPASLALTALASVGTCVIWSGIPFVAKHDYGFDKQQTFLLYICAGALYVLGALMAGRLTRRLEGILSPRALLGSILLVETVICASPIVIHGQWVLWMVAGVYSLLSSFLWPMVESYITAGRHGNEMGRAVGWFNITWMAAVAGAMLAIAPLIEHQARFAIVVMGAANLLGIVTLWWFRRSPGEHDEKLRRASVGREYPLLLYSARILLPMSYVLMAAMSPLLPYLFERLGLDVIWETPTAATWMTTRILAVGIMWYFGFWHGRWGALLLGGVTMTAGFALVVLSPSVALMLLGFASFGAGLGIVYYAALYYAMSVGGGQIAAGGKHEALIGVGYTIGPAAGLAGLSYSQTAAGTELKMAEGIGVVAVVCVLAFFGAIAALRPYLNARKARTAG